MSDLAAVVRDAGAQLDSLGQALVASFGPLNFWTAALLAGALVLDRALARHARAAWRIALYLPVGLRVLVPLDWSIRLATPPRLITYLAPPLQLFGARSAAEPSTGHALSWHALAAMTYVAVSALLIARAARGRARLRRALADVRPVPTHPGVPCPLVAHDALGPMAVGILTPRIVLPRRLLAPGEERALACVLRHEAAHLRRRDAWLSTAMQLLAILAWPVVPLWLAVARVRQLIELACDEAALAGADEAERRRYGHTLLDMAEWQFEVAPLGAGALHFGSALRARIEALASQRQWPLAAQALTLSVAPLALIGACGGSALPAAAVPTTSALVDEDASYGYEFEIDSAKNGSAAPVSALSLPHTEGDRIPPETVQAVVRAHYDDLIACYVAGRAKNPALAGVVRVKLVAGSDGVTMAATEEKSTLPDQEVVQCVLGALEKVTYPRGGGPLTVVYPIEFTP